MTGCTPPPRVEIPPGDYVVSPAVARAVEAEVQHSLRHPPERLWDGDRCKVCGHLRGDHERFPGTNKWTCDEDGCDEDLNGYCHVGRL